MSYYLIRGMGMLKSKIYPITMALLAAALFGASAPLTKILLGKLDAIPLAGFLYLGSGLGLLIMQLIISTVKAQEGKEAPLKSQDFPWLLGAIVFGGILAPIILLISLNKTPASTAALLLNFEGVATTAIAVIFFKEDAGKSVIGAIILITIASIILSWDFSNHWGFSISAIGVLGACVCWGIDNNFTRNISAKNPFTIVIVKGLVAGSFSILLALTLKLQIPSIGIVLSAMTIGFFCYGSSIVLFVFALRSLGSARTSALFGAAPFIGSLLSFVLLGDSLNKMFLISFPIMIIGTILLLKEKHEHLHKHETDEHEHSHRHDDGHHNHNHEGLPMDVHEKHSHLHKHEAIEHAHSHSPDIEHRHVH